MTLGPDGSLYGTTPNGGIYGDEGTLFKMTTNGVLTTLVSFSNSGTAPKAGVTFGPDGNLYGTTSSGVSLDGSDYWGTVIRVSTNGILTTLAKFANTNGSLPKASVRFGPDGNLYGTTYLGGPTDSGTVFSLSFTPRLNIISSAQNIILCWPTNYTGFTLQSTTNLVPSSVWSTVSPSPIVINGQNTVTNLISGTRQFYRLKK
jgi:uncharacterized repeat protein (TIGR03803 family)